MNREELQRLLPHRTPMLLVDEARVVNGEAHGSYTVRGYEWFLRGHFPGNPITPGVMLCEMMAQTACVLLADQAEGTTPYFTGLNNVRFRATVAPGDTLRSVCSIIKSKPPFYFAQGEGFVGDKLCVSAEFSFVLKK